MFSIGFMMKTSLNFVSFWVGVAALSLIPGSEALAARFIDTSGHWAESYIDALASSGVMSGFPDGSFRPDQAVTRAQFATIVSKAFQLSGSSSIVFKDVFPGHWAASPISAAAANNLIGGFPDGSFRPEQAVTRTQIWVVLANSLPRTTTPAVQTNDFFSRYRDAAAVPTWASTQVALASQANLIINYPDPTLLEPNRAATRAEVAASTYQALSQRGSSQPIIGSGIGSGLGSSPPFAPSQASADFNLQLSTVPAGSILSVSHIGNEQLLIAPNETRPQSLQVLNPIRNQQGDILIPYGSRIDGRFEPAPGGTRFVAESVLINEQLFPLAAQSEVIPDIKDPRHTSGGQVFQDATIGAAAGAILGLVTGDNVIATEELLAAGVAGAAIGNVTAPRVVVLNPQQGFTLRLTADLTTVR
jgi:hypothetical protein